MQLCELGISFLESILYISMDGGYMLLETLTLITEESSMHDIRSVHYHFQVRYLFHRWHVMVGNVAM